MQKNISPGSLNRAILLIETIANGSRKGSTLSELVARTSLPRPTIYRVLDTLIEHGWVKRDEISARYNLALGLAALGYSAISRNPIENIATTHLSILAEQLNQVVYLGVRSGLDMICIGRYESTSQIQVGRGHVGMRGPFGMTPSCLAMMAKLPHEEVNAIIHANLSRYHRIEGFDEIGFRKAVDNAIRNGYSTYDGIILDHTTSAIGVAICDPDNYPIAGIATTFITGWLDDSQWHNCLQMLKKAAENIANDLYTKEVQTM
jgi:DNA-binding IclR family transcriptional regulator